MLGRSSGNHAFLAVFVYATHATQAIVFEWKPGFTVGRSVFIVKKETKIYPLLRPSIPIGWRLRMLREIFTQQTQAPANRNAQSKQWQP